MLPRARRAAVWLTCNNAKQTDCYKYQFCRAYTQRYMHLDSTVCAHPFSILTTLPFDLKIIATSKCIPNLAPWLQSFLKYKNLVSEIQSRQRLHSASSTNVVVPATRRSSLGDRAFPVAGARAWNALPASVTAAPSLSSFWRLLKTFLFQQQLRQ